MSEASPTGAPGSADPQAAAAGTAERPMANTYAAVVLVEAVVLAVLWGFSRYFGP